jgi:AAA domain
VAVAIADQRQKTWAERALAHGRVVYVVAEDMNGFDARVEAYRRERAGFDDLPLYIIKGRPNLGTNPTDREELIEAITNELGDVRPVAIFLDTLARMVGSEGENEKGMQNFVNNVEHVAELFECLCIAIHHESAATDADRSADKPRGHTSLPGALVASWHVIKTADGIEGPWTADIIVIGAKNSATGFALQAEMKRVDLGKNRHGRMETILMLDSVAWSSDAQPVAKKKSKRTSATLSLFLTCVEYAKSAKGGTERRQVRGHDGPWVDAVEDGRVREVFFQRYAKPTKLDEEDDTRARRRELDRKTKAFDRSVAKAVETEGLFTETSADGRVFFWTS